MVTNMVVTYNTGEIISPDLLVIIDVRMIVLAKRNLRQSYVEQFVREILFCKNQSYK